MNRTSFNERELERIYEWRLALNQGMKDVCCEECNKLEVKIAKKLGKTAFSVKRLVKKNPYFPTQDHE